MAPIRTRAENGPMAFSLLVWFFILCTSPIHHERADAFQLSTHNPIIPATTVISRRKAFLERSTRQRHPSPLVLFETNNDDSESSTTDGPTGNKKSFSVARAGGRPSRRRDDDKIKPPPQQQQQDKDGWFGPALAFGLAGLLLLWGLGGSDDNFYYYSYESSVYETRTYTMDGNVETSRRESSSAKSNIPELRGMNPDDVLGSRSSVILLDNQMGYPRVDFFLEDFFEE